MYNRGGAAQSQTTVFLRDVDTNRVIAQSTLRALDGNGDSEADLNFTFPVQELPSDSQQTLEISVGIGDVEPEDAISTRDNVATETVIVPAYSTPQLQPAQPQPETETDSETNNDLVFTIPGLETEVDLSDPEQRVLLIGISVTIIAMLVVLRRILNLLFNRTPRFGTWQPPYATMPPLDPNSTYGRRQLWQQHAPNNAVPVPCQRGSVNARKVLMGMDNDYLSGWRVLALRMTQYDMYGRVSRTQVLGSRSMVNTLNNAARKAEKLADKKIAPAHPPVAKQLARELKQKINRRSAMLPIALDVRTTGGTWRSADSV